MIEDFLYLHSEHKQAFSIAMKGIEKKKILFMPALWYNSLRRNCFYE